jgi:hypothetical protein
MASEYTPLVMLAVAFGALAAVGFIAQYHARRSVRRDHDEQRRSHA